MENKQNETPKKELTQEEKQKEEKLEKINIAIRRGSETQPISQATIENLEEKALEEAEKGDSITELKKEGDSNDSPRLLG